MTRGWEPESFGRSFSHCRSSCPTLGSVCRWTSAVRDIRALGVPPRASRAGEPSSGARERLSRAAEAVKTDLRAVPEAYTRPWTVGRTAEGRASSVAVSVRQRTWTRATPPTSAKGNPSAAAACTGWHGGTCLRLGLLDCTLSGGDFCVGFEIVLMFDGSAIRRSVCPDDLVTPTPAHAWWVAVWPMMHCTKIVRFLIR